MEYKTLEPSSLSSLGVTAPSFNGTADTFFTTSSFVYTLFFVAIVMAAFYKYAHAGILRMEGTEATIRKSNDMIKQVTLGLLGVFSLFLILFTVNKGLLTGDIGLSDLQAGRAAGAASTVPSTANGTGSGGTSRICDSTNAVIQKLQSSGGICGGAACTALSNCNYQAYNSIIQAEASSQGVDPKMVIVTMCKESHADQTAQRKNPNGSYDCGLMQINSQTPCDASILNTTTNIRRGVALLKEKMLMSRQVYQNIPATAGVFAAYNCCANGTPVNAPSVDCTQSSGFPYAVPKWVCPINPGTSDFNMCSVKSYACELTACLNQL